MQHCIGYIPTFLLAAWAPVARVLVPWWIRQVGLSGAHHHTPRPVWVEHRHSPESIHSSGDLGTEREGAQYPLETCFNWNSIFGYKQTWVEAWLRDSMGWKGVKLSWGNPRKERWHWHFALTTLLLERGGETMYMTNIINHHWHIHTLPYAFLMSLLDGGGEHPEEECCSEPQYDWSRNPTHWSVKSLNYRLLSSLSLMPSYDRNPVFGQSQAIFDWFW